MQAGERSFIRGLLRAAAALVLIGSASIVGAIDNPDAPQRVAAFERRAAQLEKQLAGTDGGSSARRAGQAYADFLDSELNNAYRMLLSNLTGPARAALVDSQRSWLRFRDAEYGFIARHWTQERSGSSASLSVAGYRNELVKRRVLTLLHYAAEYP